MAIKHRAVLAEDKQERHHAILDAAARLMVRSPERVANVAEVADEAGLAKGTVYLYFPSKEELFLALHERNAAAFFEAMIGRLAEPEPVTLDFMLALTRRHMVDNPLYLPLATRCFGLLAAPMPSEAGAAFMQRMAARMRDAGQDALRGADAVIPVPLHPAREWRRGFNQAELLARKLGPPAVHVLCRTRATPPQAGLGARARRLNVRDAFALAAFPRAPGVARWANALGRWDTRRTAAWIQDRVLVLVDDVCTTGATLDACAAVLKAAGAREVRAITAARAVRAPR